MGLGVHVAPPARSEGGVLPRVPLLTALPTPGDWGPAPRAPKTR